VSFGKEKEIGRRERKKGSSMKGKDYNKSILKKLKNSSVQTEINQHSF
jgi:hypothetical protein